MSKTAKITAETIEKLRDEIRRAEMRCARINDDWLKRVQRADITAMRQKLKALVENTGKH